MSKVKKTKDSRNIKVPHNACAHVGASFNNILISITDHLGNVLLASSAGRCNFKGFRKGTPHAAQETAQDVGRRAVEMGVRSVSVKISGAGPGRDSALKGLRSSGLDVTMLTDVTGIPHNGCRPRKKRRV